MNIKIDEIETGLAREKNEDLKSEYKYKFF